MAASAGKNDSMESSASVMSRAVPVAPSHFVIDTPVTPNSPIRPRKAARCGVTMCASMASFDAHCSERWKRPGSLRSAENE